MAVESQDNRGQSRNIAFDSRKPWIMIDAVLPAVFVHIHWLLFCPATAFITLHKHTNRYITTG